MINKQTILSNIKKQNIEQKDGEVQFSTSFTILTALKIALIIVDKKEDIVAVSPEFNSLWGFEDGDVYAQPVAKTKLQIISKLISGNKPISMNFFNNMNEMEELTDIIRLKDGRVLERKSFPHFLKNKIIGRCWVFADISHQTKLVEKLKSFAFRDSLTNLYNRRWVEKKLKQVLIKKNKENVSFLYLDLDHFKVINDSCGHICGDKVLGEISLDLLKLLGKKSMLARMGGDEFGLILTSLNNGEAIAIAGKIRSTINNYEYRWKDKVFKIGVSIGLVFVQKEDDFNSVFIHADEACYLSKQTGRNKLVIYDSKNESFKKSHRELKWYDTIQKALLKGCFELWCQPINDIKSNKKHVEILLRILTEEGEILSPVSFLDSANKFGMTYKIDKKVFTFFCKFYSENRNNLKDIMFSINVSGQSLSRQDFLPFILKELQGYNVDYNNICFEVTESEVIKNMDMALLFIKIVRNLGCKVSLDDFGKGLTSFSYLKDIPYDYIKIDGQFIKEINKDKINKAIIKSIVHIAEVMNKKTIAEQIETKEIFDQVSALGVNYFQGYYFSKPHKITKLLE